MFFKALRRISANYKMTFLAGCLTFTAIGALPSVSIATPYQKFVQSSVNPPGKSHATIVPQTLAATRVKAAAVQPSYLATNDFGDVLLGDMFGIGFGFVINACTDPNGCDPYIFESITVAGSSDWAKTQDTCTGVPLNPGDSCMFVVVFTPTVAGAQQATASFVTSGGDFVDLYTGNGLAPDLSVDGFAVTQFNYDTPNVDGSPVNLVQGKSTAVSVALSAQNISSTLLNTPINVTIMLDGSPVATKQYLVSDIPTNTGLQVDFGTFYFMAPTVPANTISVSIDSIKYEVKTSNNSASNPVQLVKTYSPTIALSSISACAAPVVCHGTPGPGGFSTLLSSQFSSFISDSFPVADLSLSLTALNQPVVGDTDMGVDFLNLKIQKLLSGYNKMIGLVSSDYFAYFGHGNYAGFTSDTYGSVSLVDESAPSIAAHELGHQFGFIGEYYDPLTGFYNGPDVLGWNARLNLKAPGSKSVMGPYYPNDTIDNLWVDPAVWGAAFSSLQYPPLDPSIMIVSGLLSNAGTLSNLKIQTAPTGLLSGDEKGSVIIQSLDSSGRILNQVSVAPSFQLIGVVKAGHAAPPSVSIANYPLAVAIPNNPIIASVIIIKSDGTVLAKQSVGLVSLISLINAIPNTAFWFKAQAARELLLDEAKRFDRLIGLKRKHEALELIRLIRIEIAFGTKNFGAAGSSGLTKEQILSKINAIIDALKGN